MAAMNENPIYTTTRSEKPSPTRPRIIIHGGAGNITRANLPKELWETYRASLLSILEDSNERLSHSSATALDIATYTVTQLENNPLFNAGRGAVFTRHGKIELEASVMVSHGYRKRGVGVMGVTRVRNPILLAREMLVQGERDDGGGAQGHCQLNGAVCEDLAERWGLKLMQPGYFWTRKRWEEHRRGLGKSVSGSEYEKARAGENWALETSSGEEDYFTNDPSWNGTDYLPQGTVGCVVLDGTGTLCVATSTGGITNKLEGRIGDTPSLGAGFWAEKWQVSQLPRPVSSSPLSDLTDLISACLPSLASYLPLSQSDAVPKHRHRATAISGTGNGDSFLRLSAARTASAIARFSPGHSLQTAVTCVAGPNGMLQQSAEDRWHKTGEGEGGMIGIELGEDSVGRIVADFNCGGMFRTWVDDGGKQQIRVFRGEY